MHPRRVPRVQLRGTVPDARYPFGRQGSREQLCDDRAAGPLRPSDRARGPGLRQQRLLEGESVQAIRPRERSRLPRALLGQEETIFWNTGDEHDELGHITEDSGLRNAMMETRFAKL